METAIKKLFIVFIIISVPVNMPALSQSRFSEISGEGYTVNEQGNQPISILTLGDSNGALKDGWVTQLKKVRPHDSIFNISISGNTIGFKNLGRNSLNTLSNIDNYMEKAYSNLMELDEIIIMLGTNDCKAIFMDSLEIVPDNMRSLIRRIRDISELQGNKPTILIVSPPPFGPDELVGQKYQGGLERVGWLNEQLIRVADEENVEFINTYEILLPVFNYLSADGVHLNADGQMMIALIIEENLKYFDKNKE